MKSSKLTIREMILFGMLGALTFSLKVAMAALPNIEPVSLTLLVYAVVFGWKALYPAFIYVVMEILYFGLGTWNVCYLYVWPLLVAGGILMKGTRSSLGWSVFSGAFGLFFGALCGVVDVFIGGFAYAVAKWTSGIVFDITHCVGNFVMAMLLFAPLRRLLTRLNPAAI